MKSRIENNKKLSQDTKTISETDKDIDQIRLNKLENKVNKMQEKNNELQEILNELNLKLLNQERKMVFENKIKNKNFYLSNFKILTPEKLKEFKNRNGWDPTSVHRYIYGKDSETGKQRFADAREIAKFVGELFPLLSIERGRCTRNDYMNALLNDHDIYQKEYIGTTLRHARKIAWKALVHTDPTARPDFYITMRNGETMDDDRTNVIADLNQRRSEFLYELWKCAKMNRKEQRKDRISEETFENSLDEDEKSSLNEGRRHKDDEKYYQRNRHKEITEDDIKKLNEYFRGFKVNK